MIRTFALRLILLVTLGGCAGDQITTYGWASSDIYNASAVHGQTVAMKVGKPCPPQSQYCAVSVEVSAVPTDVGLARRGIYHERTRIIGMQ